MYMATQLNLHMTPDFERDLDRLRALRGIKTKSEAIRLAVAEAVVRGTGSRTHFESWIGLAAAEPKVRPRFQDHGEVWENRGR